MAGHGEKLSRKQEQAIGALLTSATIGDAARKIEVAERTLKNWLADPDFAAAYREAREELLSQTLATMLSGCSSAVRALLANLDADRAADRTRAAVAVLDHVLKIRDSIELRNEVAALRVELAALQAGAKVHS